MCTSIRFTDNSGHMYLGRNLDWSFDYGQQVRVMPRGFHIPYSFIDDATAAHAVIGMCIDYKNYPPYVMPMATPAKKASPAPVVSRTTTLRAG